MDEMKKSGTLVPSLGRTYGIHLQGRKNLGFLFTCLTSDRNWMKSYETIFTWGLFLLLEVETILLMLHF